MNLREYLRNQLGSYYKADAEIKRLEEEEQSFVSSFKKVSK